jgi:hypothetical protein
MCCLELYHISHACFLRAEREVMLSTVVPSELVSYIIDFNASTKVGYRQGGYDSERKFGRT